MKEQCHALAPDRCYLGIDDTFGERVRDVRLAVAEVKHPLDRGDRPRSVTHCFCSVSGLSSRALSITVAARDHLRRMTVPACVHPNRPTPEDDRDTRAQCVGVLLHDGHDVDDYPGSEKGPSLLAGEPAMGPARCPERLPLTRPWCAIRRKAQSASLAYERPVSQPRTDAGEGPASNLPMSEWSGVLHWRPGQEPGARGYVRHVAALPTLPICSARWEYPAW